MVNCIFQLNSYEWNMKEVSPSVTWLQVSSHPPHPPVLACLHFHQHHRVILAPPVFVDSRSGICNNGVRLLKVDSKDHLDQPTFESCHRMSTRAPALWATRAKYLEETSSPDNEHMNTSRRYRRHRNRQQGAGWTSATAVYPLEPKSTSHLAYQYCLCTAAEPGMYQAP